MRPRSIARGKRCATCTTRPARRPTAWTRCATSIGRAPLRPRATRSSRSLSTRWWPSSRSSSPWSRPRAPWSSRAIRSPRKPAGWRSKRAATSSMPRWRCRLRLGVVEPEASGIGGDGAAVLFLKGMKRPTVIDYKDQTPIHATPDNPAIMNDGRLVADGPAAANIPGVVAGLDYLHKKYGSGKVKWAELIEPAITVGRRRVHPRRGVADQHRRGAAVPRKVAGGVEHLFARRQGAEARRSLRQQGLRQHAARASPRTAPTRSIAARSRARLPRTCKQQRRHHRDRRPRPVSRDRTRAGRRPVSRPRALRRRSAGLDRHSAVRIAADSRELSAAPRRTHHHRCRLLPLPPRIVEGARSESDEWRTRSGWPSTSPTI